ncbi:uncharacterized protein Z518_11413 [Rhinocladiella mackenziei CBS 650.93]|uniref:Amino-acid N-acetyltransferase subunit Mak10 n=1 Tax=Rhinocladiella mackenziei CBS 650.93 TaxID=1442369 RepID=A0A0D2I859_9EURO|nr:uncharacterized protein Z518_11413 [Rhinocladiella mackenziei CBS 650.93]KIW99425.1 hypothetical protein Z518_11413 [Rhinocladiella mackenziei CBS 650.93]
MVQPQLVHPNIQVNDITKTFRDAASRLAAGNLVKDEHFTLFEAVTALEIGDPKMDSGSLAFDPEIEDDFNFATTVSAEEIIWLMDELMYREVAWHMGYPLSQTLFTSVHIERLLWPEPKQLSDARFDKDPVQMVSSPSLLRDVFQPYCIGLIKSCDLVLSMISTEHYYEEEDFATQIFNRPLLHDFPVHDVVKLVQNACLWVHNSEMSSSLKDALIARLNGRISLVQLLECCAQKERPETKNLDESIALLRQIESSTAIGKPPGEEPFTLKIQRRLASSVPPRPMIVVEKEKAFTFLRQLVTDATTAFQVLDISSSGDLLVAYQNFMAQTIQPAVYVRALLQSFLTFNNTVLGQFTLKDFIFQDLRSLVLPPFLLRDDEGQTDDGPTHQQFRLSSQIDSFVNRCGQSFLNLFRTFCLNRCRTRRTLCHAALEWDQVQAEAEDLDALAQSFFNEQPIPYPPGEEPTFSYSLSSWVYHYKLMQLRTIVQMGFELSIYAPHEFASMYWYLSHLCGTHLAHLERVSFFVSSNRHLKSSSEDEVQRTLHHLYRHFAWLKATDALAKALHRVLILLQRHHHLANPSPAYASDQLRYELRMRPFLHLSIPEPISIDVAQQSSSLQELPDEIIIEQASRLNETARKVWGEVSREGWNTQPLSGTVLSTSSVVQMEWTKDVRNTIKSCIGTGLAITALNKALQESRNGTGNKRIVEMKVKIPQVGERDRWHPSWPVPIISR